MSCRNFFNGCFDYRKRTKTELCLFILIVCCCMLAVYLMVTIYTDDSLSGEPKSSLVRKYVDLEDDHICITPSCVHSANNILNKIDDSLDPCGDFYKFVCGKFTKSTVIPEEKTTVTSFSLIRDKVNHQLKNIISDSINVNDSRPLQLLKIQYKSCMNVTKIENDSLNFVKRVFKELGGWPVLEQVWNEKKFDWKQVLYRLRRSRWRPVTFFIQIQIEPDLKNTSKRILTISQPNIPFFNILKNGLNDTSVQVYYDYIINLAKLCGASTLSASVEMKEVLDFEISLTKILVSNNGIYNPLSEYNPMTIKELQETIPSLPWLQIINNFLAPMDMLKSKDIINVASLDYFKGLEDLLAITKKRILANYMFLKLIKDSVPHLPQKFRYEEMKYLKVIQGKSRINSRWEQCIWEVDKLNVAASSVYIKKFFDQNSKIKVREIAEDIKDSFLEILNDAEWMDSKTKEGAIAKVEKMNLFIGYPDKLLNDEEVENYYKGLELNPNDLYLKMRLNLSTFLHMRNVKKLREIVDKSDWLSEVRSYVVNAFYDQKSNAIGILAALMQNIFFDPDRPQYMNYGSIGEIIGHEILHGFDDIGRKFDENGNLNNWWTSQGLQIFKNRSQCFIEQYGNVVVDDIDINLNGFHTLNENIADNGGFKIAYRGYLKWLERNKEDLTLPGLNYTQRQIFWISAAIDGCAVYKEKKLRQIVANRSHAPRNLRVLLSFMNSEEFGRDFNCSVGSFMNPKDKCQVW